MSTDIHSIVSKSQIGVVAAIYPSWACSCTKVGVNDTKECFNQSCLLTNMSLSKTNMQIYIKTLLHISICGDQHAVLPQHIEALEPHHTCEKSEGRQDAIWLGMEHNAILISDGVQVVSQACEHPPRPSPASFLCLPCMSEDREPFEIPLK